MSNLSIPTGRGPRNLQTVVVWKRWGRGRMPQALTLLRCKLAGHDWLPWSFDWPYDCPDISLAHRDPHMDEELLWMRACNRGCHCHQTASVTLEKSGLLPGDVLGLYDTPIRRGFR